MNKDRLKMAMVCCWLAFWTAPVNADVDADLANAARNLFNGRAYLAGFPQSKTRNKLRSDYLGPFAADTNSVPGTTPQKYPLLSSAINLAVQVRADGSPQVTLAQKEQAQLIAWEALEALLNGQLIAGNGNFLKGLRVAFPTVVGEEKPGGDNELPIGCPGPAAGGSYNGANITDLCYAKLHFLRGLITSLDFVANDLTSELRASEPGNGLFPQYTYFNTNTNLLDPNFNGQGPQNIQTTGYLLGNTVDRFGKAVVAIGDRLWRSAYFDKARAPGGSRAGERQEMLDAAMSQMQQGVHSLFLASLPLAATLGDGEGYGLLDEYQLCRVDQIRVATETASSFIDRIRRGELPKLDNLALNSSKTDIDQQISLVGTLKQTATSKYGEAQAKLWKKRESEAATIIDAQTLRSQFTATLAGLSGIDPGVEGNPPYFGLTTPAGRLNFTLALSNKLAQIFEVGLESPLLTDGSEIGQAILQLLRARADISSARNRIDSIPLQIAIEVSRNQENNDIIVGTQNEISAYQLAIGIAQSVSLSFTHGMQVQIPPGSVTISDTFNLTVNPGAIVAAEFQNKISRAQAIQQTRINSANSEATIKNLLLQEHQYTLDLESAAAQGQLAAAGVNSILARISRLIEDHSYYQAGNETKWYNDPALIFEQEQTEIDYEDALREYVRELYVLSQKLAARWSEPYENPYLNRLAVADTLGSSLYDPFTQPESVFNVYQASEGDNFLLALKAWDTLLRSQRAGGQADVTSVVSLRKDIYGFSEVFYNTNTLRFETDLTLRELNIRRFRALLLQNAQPAPFYLRLDFPLTYNQFSKSVSLQQQQPAVIPVSRDDWNIRITQLSAKLIGNNVAQSVDNTFRIDLYQYGKVEFARYHPRRTLGNPNVAPGFLTFNLPLYYYDPADSSVSPFKFSLNAGINGNVGTPNPFVPDVEPSPFCDRYVLLIERSANLSPINLQNIEDIELTVHWRSGFPPAFSGW